MSPKSDLHSGNTGLTMETRSTRGNARESTDGSDESGFLGASTDGLSTEPIYPPEDDIHALSAPDEGRD